MYKTLIIILLCLAGIANGDPEEVDLGEYRVYFDLGVNRSEYEIEVPDRIDSETLGGVERKVWSIEITEKGNNDFDTKGAIIGITKMEGIEALNKDELAEEIRNLEYEIYDVYADQRIIDGKEGAIARAKLGYKHPISGEIPFTGYFAEYSLNNDTGVRLFSSYGWDSGTLSLLKSLRVEEN